MTTRKCRTAILIGLVLVMVSYSEGQTVAEAWVQSDANGYPNGSMIALDSEENVVVTGWRWFLEQYIVTKKYSPNGTLLWERHFSSRSRSSGDLDSG